jgi:hypothetical protein
MAHTSVLGGELSGTAAPLPQRIQTHLSCRDEAVAVPVEPACEATAQAVSQAVAFNRDGCTLMRQAHALATDAGYHRTQFSERDSHAKRLPQRCLCVRGLALLLHQSAELLELHGLRVWAGTGARMWL